MDELLKLYRAVTRSELDDLRAHHGRFRDSRHLSGEKGFFFHLESATAFARQAEYSYGERHFIVCTEIDEAALRHGREHNVPMEGRGVYLPVSAFDLLLPAVEVHIE